MTTSQLKEELAAYLPLLSQRQQEIILDVVKNLLNIDTREKRISSTRYNQELEKSRRQIQDGRAISHSDVAKQSRKWLKGK